EVYEFLIGEGLSPSNIKLTKTPGREAKGFISDDMKNLLIYDEEVFKPSQAIRFSESDKAVLGDGVAQTFSFIANKENTITSKGGIRIFFPDNAFAFKSGLGASGTIHIELEEYNNPGEIASVGLHTMNNELPLKEACILWIKATCNDQEVRLKKEKTVKVKIPAKTIELSDPALYKGVKEGNNFNFIQSDPKSPAQRDGDDFVLSLSQLHWVACASPPKADSKGTLIVKTSASQNVSLRLILKEEKEILAAYNFPGTKDLGFSHVPSGKDAVLVAYGTVDGKTYFFSKSLTTGGEGKEKIQLKESSVEEIRQFLKNIDK
ncbi:MAG TPA: hypothetical protein VGO45_09775, partial [Bacteroidia bacterium]|nr:hypothetical protein [Bacteroidia bacterium]